MGDNSQLDTIPHAVDLEKSKSDVVSSIDSEPRSALAFLLPQSPCISKMAFSSQLQQFVMSLSGQAVIE